MSKVQSQMQVPVGQQFTKKKKIHKQLLPVHQQTPFGKRREKALCVMRLNTSFKKRYPLYTFPV